MRRHRADETQPADDQHQAVSPTDAGSSWSRAGGTTSTAEGAADAKSVAEARARGIERLGVYFRA